MSSKKALIILVVIVVLLAVAFVLDSFNAGKLKAIDSFEDCMDAGYPIMESFPRQCRTPDGRLFVEDIEDERQVPDDLPDGGENGTSSPANGGGTDMERVPEELFPSDPTEPIEEVTYHGHIDSFEECAEIYGADDSLPQHCGTPDGRHFWADMPPGAYDGCVITGCSSQVCADEEVATTCEFREAYACYSQVGICERNNNICGWRHTEALNSCVANAS